jgi:hypothetical protein
MRRLHKIVPGLLLLWVCAACGQQILIDRGVRAAGLWCFPLATNPKQYVYLPNKARLALDESGKPQFSFVRYVVNTLGRAEGNEAITSTGGGGVLHFLVLYETPAEDVTAAQRTLHELLKDKEITLRGPIVFNDGRFALVSSIINPSKSEPERKLLVTGHAPVLEGNRLAFSFDLKPEQTTLLLQSFAMKTPDVSILFDMTFAGLGEAYDAELFIDWSEVRQSAAFGAGGSIYFISADVETAFEELRRKNAIRLRSGGSDSAMEALLTTVYSKLLDLMFRPVEPERVPPGQRGGLMDALNTLIDQRGGLLSSRRTTGFGAYVGYQLKDLRSSGTSVLNFNHRATLERHSFIAFNMGDLYSRFGNDPAYFRTINLADPAFQQRDVHVRVDGALLSDFDRYINSVTVTLRKVHQNGQETVREIALNRENFKPDGPGLRMIYGWNGDDDRLAWLQYDYRTRWSFKGGGTYQTEWKRMDAPMIDLFAPYERRTAQVVSNPDLFRTNAALRAVIVQLEYDFFGEKRRPQLVVRAPQPVEPQPLELVLPLNQWDYGYTTTWILDGGRRLTARGRDSTGLVFIDEMPKDNPPPGSAAGTSVSSPAVLPFSTVTTNHHINQ